MKKSQHRVLFICIAIAVYFIGGIIAIDVVDPAFIPNQLYRVIIYRFGTVFSLLLTVYLIFSAIKRYKTDPSYRSTVQYQFHDFNFKGKCKLAFSLLFSPLLIGMMLWILSVPAIELYGHYYYAKPWSDDYYVVKVESCGSDYEADCSKVKLLDVSNKHRFSFRWYEDRTALAQLKTQRITLRGYEGLFGRTVEEIRW